jgi:hypothetical protein
MTRAPFIVIDGRLYRWKDILELRRAQLAAAGAAQASQLALFASLLNALRSAPVIVAVILRPGESAACDQASVLLLPTTAIKTARSAEQPLLRRLPES